MECSAAGAVITIVQTPGCPKTHITTKDGDDNSDDFSPAGQIDFLEPATAVPGAGPMMKVAN